MTTDTQKVALIKAEIERWNHTSWAYKQIAKILADPAPAPTPSPWTLLYADDFTKGYLPKEWTRYDQREPGGDPAGWFRADRIAVATDLHIFGAWDSAKGRWATGGVGRWAGIQAHAITVNSKVEVDYRCAADADGYLYSLLLWPQKEGSWPIGCEVDYAEDISRNRDGFNAVFHHGAGNIQEQLRTPVDMTKPHTVGVEWTPGLLVYTLDGHEWGRCTTGVDTMTGPMIPTLQLQANGASVWNKAASAPTDGLHITALRAYRK